MGKTLRNVHKALFFGLIVLLPTQLGYHFWPEWAGVLGRRVDYLAPTIYLTDILIGLILLSWIIGLVTRMLNYESGIMNKIRIKTLCSFSIHNSAFIILPLLFVGFNVFFAGNRPVAIYKWLKVLEFIALGWYIVKTKPSVSLISYLLSLTVLYSSLIAIGQFALQHSIGGPLWWLGERTFSLDTPGIAKFQSCQLSAVSCQLLLRPYATFPHPNVLGGFLAATIPLLMASMRQRVNASAQWLFRLSLILGTIALVLTFSRSAIVVGAVAISMTLLFCHSRESGNPVFVLSWILGPSPRMTQRVGRLLVFIFCLLALVFGSWFLVQSFQPSDESVVVRQQLNAAAIKLWQQSPVLGVGLGNFLVELPKALPSRTVYFLQPVHNIYLLVLAETGVVGLAVFLWVIWKAFMRFEIRKIRKPFSIYHLAFGIFLLLGLVDHYPLTLQQGQLLLTIFLSLSLSRDT
ncbi:MAG: O-antigen ligase family protein [Patescibacteria group bacterium]